MYDSCKGSNNMISSYHELKRFITRDYILSRDLLIQYRAMETKRIQISRDQHVISERKRGERERERERERCLMVKIYRFIDWRNPLRVIQEIHYVCNIHKMNVDSKVWICGCLLWHFVSRSNVMSAIARSKLFHDFGPFTALDICCRFYKYHCESLQRFTIRVGTGPVG